MGNKHYTVSDYSNLLIHKLQPISIVSTTISITFHDIHFHMYYEQYQKPTNKYS
jgi:hypothetical protein